MKKLTSSILAFSLALSLNLLGQMLDLDIEFDDSDYAELQCVCKPFDRPNGTRKAVKEETQELSLNWAGYVSLLGKGDVLNPTTNSVKQVSGTWVVPAVTPNVAGDTFSSAWVGIDGFSVNSLTVEQIGTEHDVISGAPSYYAWYEMYPFPAHLIEGFPVFAGDVIEGKVEYKGLNSATNQVFELSLKNHTQKVKFHTKQAPSLTVASRSSANWIVEAPSTAVTGLLCDLAILPLANFNTIAFRNCKAKIRGHNGHEHEGPIDNKHWTFVALSMVTVATGQVKAAPSALKKTPCLKASSGHKSSNCGGSSFVVTWMNSGPFPGECPSLPPG